MTFDVDATQFSVRAKWPNRREKPDAIAERLRLFLDQIVGLDDSLAHWSIGRKRRVSYQTVRSNLASLIERDVNHDELGAIERSAGYAIIGGSKNERQGFSLIGEVGGVYPYPQWNRLWFHTRPGRPPNPDVATYALIRSVLLAMIANWQPLFAIAGSSDLPVDQDRCGWFREAWLTYVPPQRVDRVDLVGIPFSERTADGGLLLSATDQTFRADVPAHVEGARRISQALQPLNATLPRLIHPFDWPAQNV